MKKRRGLPGTKYHKLSDAVDESLSKARGALSLLMSMSCDGRCEEEEHVANVIWLIDDELERLDEKIADFMGWYAPKDSER